MVQVNISQSKCGWGKHGQGRQGHKKYGWYKKVKVTMVEVNISQNKHGWGNKINMVEVNMVKVDKVAERMVDV